ncbi:hypothetical protein F53441_4899 [Fusarium austroafricanum]|uniref:Uncharacterized protein n=1 Tax=Fusarium austroafricanum TaxID=2364996 RepID=A0A8H4P163_9HYPO|nr:hypothetical protein F53441_4899 [Fusarium austroafricanum]
MTSHTTTSLLLPAYTGNFVADIIGADATATTLVLDCDFKKDKDDCGLTKDTIIVGPWADKTPAPGAATTGLYKEYMAIKDKDDDYTFSVQCDMSKTYAEICTTINIGGNDNGSPTATFPRTASDTSLYKYHGYGSFIWIPVTVTAGQEHLSATKTASTDVFGTAKAAKVTTPDKQSTSAIDDGDLVTITGEADPSKTSDNVVTITGEAVPSNTSDNSAHSLCGLGILASFGLALVAILL